MHVVDVYKRQVHIHTVDFRCKKCCFLSACTGTEFDDDVLVIVRVLWQKKYFKLLLKDVYKRQVLSFVTWSIFMPR